MRFSRKPSTVRSTCPFQPGIRGEPMYIEQFVHQRHIAPPANGRRHCEHFEIAPHDYFGARKHRAPSDEASAAHPAQRRSARQDRHLSCAPTSIAGTPATSWIDSARRKPARTISAPPARNILMRTAHGRIAEFMRKVADGRRAPDRISCRLLPPQHPNDESRAPAQMHDGQRNQSTRDAAIAMLETSTSRSLPSRRGDRRAG